MHLPPRMQGKLVNGQRNSLEPLRDTLRRLNSPERHFPAVLISGTNGKGSTTAYLSRLLTLLGLRVGSFTSPSLLDVRELVRLDGQVLSRQSFERLCDEVLEHAGPEGLTLFELLTAVAFEAFARAKVQVAVIEVGMGGRLDATNLCEPMLSIITHVALDHVEVLGPTVEAIAQEKAGILRAGHPLLTGATSPALEVLKAEAARLGSPLYRPGEDFGWREGSEPDALALNRGHVRTFEWRVAESMAGFPARVEGLSLGMRGPHQWENAGLALAAALVLAERFPQLMSSGPDVFSLAARQALSLVQVPGRLERLTLPNGAPLWLDGAHNPDGMQALGRFLQTLPEPERPRQALMATFADKNLEDMLPMVVAGLERLVCTRSQNVRSVTPQLLVATAQRLAPDLDIRLTDTVPDALEMLCRLAEEEGVARPVLACGSLSLVAEVHAALNSTSVMLSDEGVEL